MEQKNVIWAIGLSLVILLGFQYFYEIPKNRENARINLELQQQVGVQNQGQQPENTATKIQFATRNEALEKSGPRIPILSPRLSGSIALIGARFDDLTLTQYRENVDVSSKNIDLLQPVGTPDSYFVEFGWISGNSLITALPKADTLWQTSDHKLEPGKPLHLHWDNGQGQRFHLIFTLDENYMVHVEQQVDNTSEKSIQLFPYSRIVRAGTPQIGGYFILHEGLIGVANDELKEIDYSEVQEAKKFAFDSRGGWSGFTDKYWLVALIPFQQDQVKSGYSYLPSKNGQAELYQVDYLLPAVTVNANSQTRSEINLFAGAKEVEQLDKYADKMAIPLFDRAVDFGWFYFLTKPIFLVLKTLYDWIGNFGVAILLLTVFIKLLLYPLANKSYRSMAKMKLVGPEMAKLRERYGSDRQKLNQEMIALYKREKLNPAAGCLPIIIQIPIFFSLYKVLFVTIEMRHAPFFGWIQDLSAPDPTSILNLFGLLPWVVPASSFGSFLNIGIWPILMGLSMYFQQRLNPAPPDPIQAKIFKFLPILFTFMLAHFAAGLVIYWTWNNLLSILQQRLITRDVMKAPAKKYNKSS